MGRYARNSIGQYAPVGAAADDLPGGATPTGKKTIDTTAEVDVASYATAQVVDENLTAENIRKDVSVLGITGEYEGGSSDFTTAEVTITNNTSGSVGINVPYAEDNTSVAYTIAGNLADTTLTVILYKGTGQFEIDDDGAKIGNVTGDITTDGDYTAIIAGTGTITIEADIL